ncbi:MFS transporter [Streptomyces guryensis]|uniref:MFS transporter n=1 Tax=Streptomyces guryensis TaxID=2886947 RepID=A0A9Q3VPK8_9ACTN|nr:MFS transporter [Streptomyces guryensis]MCD9874660.1 MFS transporter [Streptomyces guryensis]
MTSLPDKDIDDPTPEAPDIPLRLVPDFRWFWLSRVVSGLGSAVTTVALPVLAFQETGSPLMVSLVAAAATLPYVVFGLIAGTVADRTDRRRLMILTDWLNAGCIASVPAASALGILTGGQVLLVALVSAALGLFFDAGVYGFVPDIVGKDKLTEANSAVYGAQTVVRIAGNAVAGALIVLFRPAGTLALDALSFAASALLLKAVTHTTARSDKQVATRPGFKESVREGLGFLHHHPTLRLMTVVGTLQSFSGGAIIGQLVVFADRVLGIHGSDGRIGLLYMAWSAGGIGGSFLLPRLRRHFEAFPLLLGVLPLGSLLGLVVVLSSDWRVTMAALTLWGSAYLVVLVNTMTYSQEVTPAELQGRVNTTRRMLSSGLGVPLGALVAGTLTVRAGVQAGMSTAVGSIALAALLVWSFQVRGRLRQRAGA